MRFKVNKDDKTLKLKGFTNLKDYQHKSIIKD